MKNNYQGLKDAIELCAKSSIAQNPDDPDSAARCFVAQLSGTLMKSERGLSDLVFSVVKRADHGIRRGR